MTELIKVANKEEGQVKAREILLKIVDSQTLLVLSGGKSINYKKILQISEGDILPGAVCVGDERFGRPYHNNSNEQLLKKAGVKKYCDKKKIPFYKFLCGKDFLKTAEIYEKKMQDLFLQFPSRVGVMGVGTDFHTAGIFPYAQATKVRDFVVAEEVDDKFKKRLTLTISALSDFTNFVVLMFGQEKKEALQIMIEATENDMQRYPAILYRKFPVKTYVISDIEL